jgi:hypothetical protein
MLLAGVLTGALQTPDHPTGPFLSIEAQADTQDVNRSHPEVNQGQIA